MKKRQRLHIRRLVVLVVFWAQGGLGLSQDAAPAEDGLPRLVVTIIVDGLSQEQLLGYRDQLIPGGFKRLTEKGAWLTNAHYAHATTWTSTGHATVLTGAHPYRHGLIGNGWTDRSTGRNISSVEDPDYVYLDEATPRQAGTSPKHLKVSSLGDELLTASQFNSKVLSISGKDTAAILSGGRNGSAYFFSSQTGRFITSSYYRDEYPDWWRDFHARNPQDRWFGASWRRLYPARAYARSAADGRPQHIDYRNLGKAFPHLLTGGLAEPGPDYYAALLRTPFGNDYTLEFVKAAIRGESLGKNSSPFPDLLALSLSTQDRINHLFGPESQQAQDHFLRLDRSLADFLAFLDEWVGLSNSLVLLTADHGFPDTPEHCQERGLEAGRIDQPGTARELNGSLETRFGPGRYVISWAAVNNTVYLDRSHILEKQLTAQEVENTAAEFLLKQPGVESVLTKTQIESGPLPATGAAQQVRRSWDPDRSGDLYVIQKPCWFLLGPPDTYASTHGSPHSYDTHVPVVFLGRWFKPGEYDNPAAIVDIVSTLVHLLGIQAPSGNEGRVLREILR